MRRALLSLVALALGCGSSGFSSGEVADRWERQFCKAQVACGAATDIESCRESIDSSYWLEVEAKIEAGEIEFDADAAAECIDLLTDDACQPRDTPLADALLQACLDGFQGQRANGDDCIVDEECAGGVCIFAPDQGDDVCDIGQCTEFVGDGVECDVNPCLPGFYCEAIGGICEPLIGVSQSCEPGDQCVPGAVCYAGVCERQGDPDGACIPELGFSACRRFDNWCDPADETCKARVGEGDSCDVEIDECGLDAVCVAGECRLLPLPGEGCDPGVGCAGDSICEGGLCEDVIDDACTASVELPD